MNTPQLNLIVTPTNKSTVLNLLGVLTACTVGDVQASIVINAIANVIKPDNYETLTLYQRDAVEFRMLDQGDYSDEQMCDAIYNRLKEQVPA